MCWICTTQNIALFIQCNYSFRSQNENKDIRLYLDCYDVIEMCKFFDVYVNHSFPPFKTPNAAQAVSSDPLAFWVMHRQPSAKETFETMCWFSKMLNQTDRSCDLSIITHTGLMLQGSRPRAMNYL